MAVLKSQGLVWLCWSHKDLCCVAVLCDWNLVWLCCSGLHRDAVWPCGRGCVHHGLQLPNVCASSLRHRSFQFWRQTGLRVALPALPSVLFSQTRRHQQLLSCAEVVISKWTTVCPIQTVDKFRELKLAWRGSSILFSPFVCGTIGAVERLGGRWYIVR